MKHIFILLLLLTSFAFSGDKFKMYKFKSGIILYDVKTASFDDNLNSQVEGIAKLIFDDWGAKELKEEDTSEVQQGDFNETAGRHTLTKLEYGTVYTVDFDEKKIYKSRDKDLDLAIAQKLDISDESVKSLERIGAKKIGTEKVAGYECDVWEYKDQQMCLYKGIPLKIVIQNAGFYSVKKAVSIEFNKTIPTKEFMLPNFPIVEDGSYSNNRASLIRTDDYIQSILDLKKAMAKKGINLEDKNVTITPDLQKDIINELGKRYLAKQKKYLRPLIDAMKKAKECIKNAKNGKEAKECIKPVRDINDKLGDRTPHFDFENFSENVRKQAIEELTKEIKNTEVTANCVDKHDKTTDVIICTEGTLLPQESSAPAPTKEINSSN